MKRTISNLGIFAFSGFCAGQTWAVEYSRHYDYSTTTVTLKECLLKLSNRVVNDINFDNGEYRPYRIEGEIKRRTFWNSQDVQEFTIKDKDGLPFVVQVKVDAKEDVHTDLRTGIKTINYTCSLSKVDEAFKLFNQTGMLIEDWDIEGESFWSGFLGGGGGCD